MKSSEKKQNFFLRIIISILSAIKWFFVAIFFCIAYIIVWPFSRCKVLGKEKVNKSDEARVFVTNHYQLYGPLSVFMNFPYPFRPWIIDTMMDPKKVEHQMGLMVYHEYRYVPKFIKWFVLKIIKNLMVFAMYVAKGISVSRTNLRANIKTMQISTETLEKKKALIIFPEKDYVNEGVGIFMGGFEHIAKYYYSKTGKKITFYPMFISQKNKKMYICDPITYNPENNPQVEKNNTISYLRESMVSAYEKYEIKKEKYNKKIKN